MGTIIGLFFELIVIMYSSIIKLTIYCIGSILGLIPIWVYVIIAIIAIIRFFILDWKLDICNLYCDYKCLVCV